MTWRSVSLSAQLGTQTALCDVNLSLELGQLHALLGPNGAGKSTLLRALAGDLREDEQRGSVLLDDIPLRQWRPRQLAQRRAYLPQRPEHGFHVTVRQLVSLGRLPWPAGVLPAEADPVTEAMERCGVTHLADRAVSHLSGGQRALAHIARALAQISGQDHPWLLLDEPTAALDIAQAEQVMTLLHTLAQGGLGVVVATHDLAQALRHSDQVHVLAAGALVTSGPTQTALTVELVEHVWGVSVEAHHGPQGRWVAMSPKTLSANSGGPP